MFAADQGVMLPSVSPTGTNLRAGSRTTKVVVSSACRAQGVHVCNVTTQQYDFRVV